MENMHPKPGYSFATYTAIIAFHRIPELRRQKLFSKVTKNQLDQFKEVSGLSYDIIASILGIRTRTLHLARASASGRFKNTFSQSIIRLIDLYGFGYSKFRDPLLFNRWMVTGSPEDGYRPPYLLLNEQDGTGALKMEILRLSDFPTNLYK